MITIPASWSTTRPGVSLTTRWQPPRPPTWPLPAAARMARSPSSLSSHVN